MKWFIIFAALLVTSKSNAGDPAPSQRMVMIGREALVRMTVVGCTDWDVSDVCAQLISER